MRDLLRALRNRLVRVPAGTLCIGQRSLDELGFAGSSSTNLMPGDVEYGDMPPEEVEVVCRIVRAVAPRAIFEFGTFRGSTTLRLAASSDARVVTLDLIPGGRDATDPSVDVRPEKPGVCFEGRPEAARITQLLGDSQTFDFGPHRGQYDVVLVDASHEREHVANDTATALLLARPGGVVLWHDYAEYAPGVVSVLEELNESLALDRIAGTTLVVLRTKSQ